MRVALVTIATNRYLSLFIEPLLESAERWFFPDDEVTTYVFSNKHADFPVNADRRIACTGWGFPEATLYRYRLITDHADEFDDQELIVWCDADMLFVGPVGREIVPKKEHGGLVAVLHPGFWRGGGSWEERPESTAFTPPWLRRRYFAGGLNGGTGGAFLAMATELADKIDADTARGMTAVWHDESHLNRFLSTRTPLALSPAYCYPSHLELGHGIEKRVLALFKDHAEVRS